MGITASLASGVTANFGTMTKPLHSGHAARDGILAVQLGSKGFTASATALEGRDGFFENFARGLERTMEPFNDLGKSYDLEKYGYKVKPYPSGGLGHTAIDAALELRGGVPLADIAKVEVAITKYAGRRYTSTYPQTVENAKFSGPYLAAYTLVHGAPMLAAFTEEALHDEAVRAFARKVTLTTYQEHADVLDESPAKVTVTLNDGRTIRAGEILSERIGPGADDQGADRGEIHRLRDDGDQAGCRKKNPRHAEHDRRAAVVRRVLAAAKEGLSSAHSKALRRGSPCRAYRVRPTNRCMPRSGSHIRRCAARRYGSARAREATTAS